jgi:hypothetical protein
MNFRKRKQKAAREDKKREQLKRETDERKEWRE